MSMYMNDGGCIAREGLGLYFYLKLLHACLGSRSA